MAAGKLILIPVPLAEEGAGHTIPNYVGRSIEGLRVFLVENLRTARRMLRQIGFKQNFDELQFLEMGKHAGESGYQECLKHLKAGTNVGLMSEAGSPCIADPGSRMVQLAQAAGIEVLPLVGPSSILLALIGSGFNGQHFCFNGYLPIDEKERALKLRDLEKLAAKGQTQIFMEVPFRNEQLFKSILQHCREDSKLCIACNLSLTDQWIRSRSMAQWKKEKPDLHKKLCVFVLGH